MYIKINRKKSRRTIIDECDDCWREIIIKRAKGKCEIKWCGSNDRVEAHHIYERRKYFSLRHDIENGIALCYNCHRNFAHRSKNIFRQVISEIRNMPYLELRSVYIEQINYYEKLEELKKCLSELL